MTAIATSCAPVERLLEELVSAGVHLSVEAGALRYRGAPGALTTELRARVAARRDELLALLSRPCAAAPALVADEPFEQTELQQAYWLGESGSFELGGVRAHLYGEFDRPRLDVARLRAVAARLVERHPMLRAVPTGDGRQRIVPPGPALPFIVEDLSPLPEAEVADRLAATRERMVGEGPPTDAGPPLELRVHALPGGFRVHVAVSLLVVDGHSVKRLAREFRRLYEHPACELPPAADAVAEIFRAVTRPAPDRLARALAYWRPRLPELSPAPELPFARSPSSIRRATLRRLTAEIEAPTWQALRAAATRRGITPASALAAIFAEVLALWSRSPAFTLNVMVSNRRPVHPAIEAVVGNLSTTTPLQIDATPRGPFVARARALNRRLWTDLQHAEVGGVRLGRELQALHGGAARSMMSVVFSSHLEAEEDPSAGWREHLSFGSLQTPQVHLDHQVFPCRGGVLLDWDFVSELFPPPLVEAMVAAQVALARRLAGEEAAWDETIVVRPPAEQLAVQAAANATDAPLPGGLLHDGFLASAAARPAAEALCGGEQRLDYRALDRLSGGWARALLRAGVRPGELVAIHLEKGVAQVVAALAVARSGGAYVPMDASLPAERVRLMVADSGARVLVTTGALAERARLPEAVTVLVVDELAASDEPPPPAAVAPTDLAYVIYTSGSTGRPKGVMIAHQGAVNTLVDMNRRFGVRAGDRVLAVSQLGFDLSVFDVFGLLAAGGTVVVPPSADVTEPARLLEWLARERISVWNSVPALLEMAVERAESTGQGLPPSLRLVFLSGDWIPLGLPERIRRLAPGVEVVSLGGATEASIWSIFHRVDRVEPHWRSVPYGKPLANQRFHVLDDRLEPRPTWAAGELYIAGAGLALGYLHDPARTAERFVVHPRTGERLYRTGDLGRYLPDGAIEFLGREDGQVKVQGFRIETGEIERSMESHPRVRAAAAQAVGEPHGPKLLAGWFVADEALEPEALRAFLEERLPRYMVPSRLTRLDALPLSANGKVDRRQLLLPGFGAERREARPPGTELERALVGLWEATLRVAPIGVDDDFFALGGHSLLAARLAAELERRLGRRVSLSALLRAPTVARLAAALSVRERRPSRVVPLREGGEPALWLVHPIGGHVVCYADLARRLRGSFAIRGLEAPSLEEHPEARSVGGLARRYVAELRAHDGGPAVLAGWSMGGLIALEMARQLAGEGAAPARVLLIDPPLALASLPGESALLAWFARDLATRAGVAPIDPSALDGLPPSTRRDRVWAHLRGAGAVDAAVPSEQLARWFELFRAHAAALVGHAPVAVACPVVLLQAAERPSSSPPTAAVWRRLLGPALEVVEVPGDHDSMFSQTHVGALAAAVDRWMEA